MMPLLASIVREDTDTAMMLIANRADVSAADAGGATPFALGVHER